MDAGFYNMDSIHFDVLTEVGNIGAGNAVTSLSKMMKKKVNMLVPSAKLVPFSQIHNLVGGGENIVFAVLFDLSGEILGKMMFVLQEECARLFINAMLDLDLKEVGEIGEYELSALKEVGNILTSSYLNSLASFVDKKIFPSIPYLAHDMAAAVISVPAVDIGKNADEIIFIESVFEDTNLNISGYFILIPDGSSFKVIMDSLGVVL